MQSQRLFEYHKNNYMDYLKDYTDDEGDIDNIEREYIFENWARAVIKYSSILASDIWDENDDKSLKQCRGEKNTICEKMLCLIQEKLHPKVENGCKTSY